MDALANASNLGKALFIMFVGISGVFFALILFFFLIKLITSLFPYKQDIDAGKSDG